MTWASKLKGVAKARGETLTLSPDLELALLAQERQLGRVEEPYDAAQAAGELKRALGNIKDKAELPDRGYAPWQQLAKTLEAEQGLAQAKAVRPEIEKVKATAPVPEILKVTDAVKTIVLQETVAEVYVQRPLEEEAEEEEEQGMGR